MGGRRGRIWAPAKPEPPDEAEKRRIIAACESLIRDFHLPRFLPVIRESELNHCIGIHGAWAGGRYRFIQRYRVGSGPTRGEEFDAPFTRLDRVAPDRFDLYWMRHTGKWWPLHHGLTLDRALQCLREDELLFPS